MQNKTQYKSACTPATDHQLARSRAGGEHAAVRGGGTGPPAQRGALRARAGHAPPGSPRPQPGARSPVRVYRTTRTLYSVRVHPGDTVSAAIDVQVNAHESLADATCRKAANSATQCNT